ncbi:MAG: hypothetical protein KME40_25780 [Komarekiella atlantica HA4396-MV6]|nr:hypothetical protein [Komarekiella atlantica HA4396-MV6]
MILFLGDWKSRLYKHSFGLQSKGGSIFLDWIAGLSLQDCDRIAYYVAVYLG